jgi:hypothetical protein
MEQGKKRVKNTGARRRTSPGVSRMRYSHTSSHPYLGSSFSTGGLSRMGQGQRDGLYSNRTATGMMLIPNDYPREAVRSAIFQHWRRILLNVIAQAKFVIIEASCYAKLFVYEGSIWFLARGSFLSQAGEDKEGSTPWPVSALSTLIMHDSF